MTERSVPFDATDHLAINTIRTLAMDMIQEANSGHPGLPMGAAPMAYVLWQRHLKVDPGDPSWPDRDRFVLSAGHGSALLYAMLHLYGYDLSLADLRAFRQWGSRTPGHPEFGHTPGVEATTGPLGQGAANAVGMAMAERMLARRFTPKASDPGAAVPLLDHCTYALVSDGDLMEGIAAEAGSNAGHWGLGKLVYLYDANDVTLDGPADICMSPTEIPARYEAAGWQVLTVADGDHDLRAIDEALTLARAETARPSLIVVKTTIGYGSPSKAGTASAHGAPLGQEELAASKAALGWDPDARFLVPEAARDRCRALATRGAEARRAWGARLDAWLETEDGAPAAWAEAWEGQLPAGWDQGLPSWEPGARVATRKAGGAALNSLAATLGSLVGGDADLSCSTGTAMKGLGDFEGQGGTGRNIRFGIREHAMAAIVNGLCYHGGLRAYASTFFVFSDYMRPAVRLAAMNKLPAIYAWTHDSVAVGEDGPTHQPVEHLMALRIISGLNVIRPADANETAQAWRLAIETVDRPTALVLSRQDLPVLEGVPSGKDGVARGAYVLSDAPDGAAQAILIATGSEVHVALEAQQRLAELGMGVRVVSMPCWELFEQQDAAWQDAVLPPSVLARVSLEAGAPLGWERYVGSAGCVLGIDRFGASGPGGRVLSEFGMTPEAVVEAARRVVSAL